MSGGKKKGSLLKRVLLVLLALVVVGGVAFVVYARDYYHAEPEALDVLDDPGVDDHGDVVALWPEGEPVAGLVFYPGAKVEAESYLPLLDSLRDRGIACFLVRMPLNFAFFKIDAASGVMNEFPQIDNWYVGGHSLGGAMASVYASGHEDEVDGLVLLGSSIYGDYPPEEALTVYGSLNQSVEDRIDYTENVVEIEGGNHAQFGNYGPQAGDEPATITADEQQEVTADAIQDFVEDDLAA